MQEAGAIMGCPGWSHCDCLFAAIRVRAMIFWRNRLDGTKLLTI